jgi:hypothetical protein
MNRLPDKRVLILAFSCQDDYQIQHMFLCPKNLTNNQIYNEFQAVKGNEKLKSWTIKYQKQFLKFLQAHHTIKEITWEEI